MFSKVKCPTCGAKNSKERITCAECGAPLDLGQDEGQLTQISTEGKKPKKKPRLNKEICVSCGICESQCPKDVIEMKEGKQ